MKHLFVTTASAVSIGLIAAGTYFTLPGTAADKTGRSNSPQDITNDTKKRRNDANKARKDNNRPTIANREVRTYDGTNNNLGHPDWGATFIHLRRLGSPDYADGISAMAAPERPSARVVSNEIAAQADGTSILNDFGTSDFMWQWGQFLDHDIDLTDGSTDEAAFIPIPKGDPYFDPEGTGSATIPFHRAHHDPQTGTGRSNPREQENEITSWIDGSMVYGSDTERAAAMREGPDSPYLKTSNGKLLPYNEDHLANANGFVADPGNLFLAGDVRANEQLGLTAMHTLFVREHNRLAKQLTKSDPKASADEIFETARRLVIAEIQIITYEAFLPALLGKKAIGKYKGYDSSVQPDVHNEFSVAAYRLGHSMLSDEILRLDAKGREIAAGHVPLRDSFFAGHEVLKSKKDLDPILRGLAGQRHQRIDPQIVEGLRNFLFGAPGAGGFDLASLNIQRGRDHGVGSYNDTRRALDLQPAADFDDITSDPALQDALRQTYGSVEDIDLWVGGLAEDPLVKKGSQVGELFREILILQFEALRDGDRFWYERDLTKEERDLVDGVTLARVIRKNTGIGKELQKDVFYVQ